MTRPFSSSDSGQHRHLSRILGPILLFAIAVSFCLPLSAQVSGQGSIAGIVTDTTGAVVQDATVVATEVATGVASSRKTTATGYYVISPLSPGTYAVSVSAPGFQKLLQEHIQVDALQAVGLDLRLTVGGSQETVVVTSAPPTLETENGTLGSVMENQTYSELPIALSGQQARDPTAFTTLMAGVTGGGRSGIFNGAGTGNLNEMYIEGIPLTTVDSQGDNRKINQSISLDAVDQFQVQTSGSSSAFQGAGVENFSIKQGTNKFHGSVYDFVRNTAFDSWNYFQKNQTVVTSSGATVPASKSPEHQNEFSVTLGGPVKHNKLFFFANYDRYHYSAATNPGLLTVPTTAARGGDFTAYPLPVYDPTTINACTAANKGVTCASQFKGMKNGVPTANVIPASEISPQAQYMMKFLPAPSNSNLSSNFLWGHPLTNRNWEFTGRTDYTLSNRQQLAFIISVGTKNYAPGLDYGATSVLPAPYTNGTEVTEHPTNVIVKDTFIFTPQVVNQLKYGYIRYSAVVANPTYGNSQYTAGSAVGIGNLLPGQMSQTFPGVTFKNGNDSPSSWSAPNGYYEAANTFTVADDLLWTRGRHAMTFGLNAQWLQFNQSVAIGGTQPLSLTFNATNTSGYNSKGVIQNTTTGHSFASYLIGAVDSATLYSAPFSTLGSRFKTLSPYFQDDFRVNAKLILNLGLRYDLYAPFHETQNRWSFFNPNITNPITGTPGVLQYAGKGANACNCDTPVQTYHANIGPRFGFAYSAMPKTVVRGAYNIMYTHGGGVGGSNNGNYNGTGQLGMTVSPLFSDSGSGGIPAFYLNSNFGNTAIPPYSTAINPTSTVNTGNYVVNGTGVTPGAVSYADPVLSGRAPYVENWNFGVERSITNDVNISVNYSGSAGHFLVSQGRGYWQDQLDPKYLVLQGLLTKLPGSKDSATGQTYLQEAQAIMPGIALPYASFGGAQGTIAAMLRPFPQYSGITDSWGDIGNSNFHSLQLTLKQRQWHGLNYTLNYTFGKMIDDLAGSRTGYAIPGSVIDGGQSWSVANRVDRSLSASNVPHQLRFFGVYSLPFGPGRLGGGNRVASSLIREWKFSWISSYTAGVPMSITDSCLAVGQGTCYPSYNPAFSGPVRINGGYGSGITAATASNVSYINHNAFIAPYGNGGYNLGNVPRTGPFNLFTAGTYNIDTGVKRTFDIWESVKFTFQADCFNVTNHAQLSGITTSLTSSTFGSVTKQGNSARDWQFAGKINF